MKDLGHKVLAYIAYMFSRLLTSTLRVEYRGLENLEKAKQLNQGRYIYALWHQNLLMALSSHTHDKCAMIVSASGDGQLVATACEKYGHYPVRGSSHRGAIKALFSMIETLKQESFNGAITVDGPKGPRHVVKRGIIDIAKKTQLPIIPLAIYPKKAWTFNSWDQFRMPKPFSKFFVYYGEPFVITSNLALDNYDKLCQEIGSSLLQGEEKIKNL